MSAPDTQKDRMAETIMMQDAEIARLTAALGRAQDEAKAERLVQGALRKKAEDERDAAMAGRGKVKPLVWESFDAWTYWAASAVGTYRVQERNGVWKATIHRKDNDDLIYEYTTDGLTPNDFEAAQIAAQADYEARILAALQPDTERAEPVAWGVGGAIMQGGSDGPAPAPQTREITVQEAAEVPEVKALIEAAQRAIDGGYISEAIGEEKRDYTKLTTALAAMQKGG